MYQDIISGSEALAHISKGVSTVAEVVGGTLGPNGGNVLITLEGRKPFLTKDGVTVARSIKKLKNAHEDAGAKVIQEAALLLNASAGDGTTTATLVTQGMLNAAIVALEKKEVTPHQVKEGLKKMKDAAIEIIKQHKIKVEYNDPLLEMVATISANNNPEVGKIVAEAMRAVKGSGFVTVSPAKDNITCVKKTSGFAYEKGFSDATAVNSPKTNSVEIDNPLMLVYPGKITQLIDIQPAMLIAVEKKRPLMVVCEGVEGEALSAVRLNMNKGVLHTLVTTLPEFGAQQKHALEDLAIAVGATVATADNGIVLSKVKLEHLGSAEHVSANMYRTIITSGAGSSEKITDRISQIRSILDDEDRLESQVTILERRAARLEGTTATIFVGGSTEVEQTELKFLVDDAVSAAKAALEQGVIPGGCTMNRNIIPLIQSSQTYSEIPKAVFHIFLSGMLKPLSVLIDSSGLSDQIVFDKIAESIAGLKEEESGNAMFIGFNFKTKKAENLLYSGVVDPAKVLIDVIETAVSLTSTFLFTHSSIVDMQ